MRPYFAAEPPYSTAIASRVMERVDKWYERLPGLRAYERSRVVRQKYYNLPSEASPFDGVAISDQGAAGELSAISLNLLAVFAQRILSMTVQDDLGWQPVAANMDSASREDAAIARSVLDYERRAGRLDQKLSLLATTAFLDGDGFIAIRWDVRGGTKHDEVKDPNTGQTRTIYAGRLRATLHPWWRTPVDLFRKDPEHDWVILVDYLNKYDLAAQFASGPGQEDLRSRILGLKREHWRVLESQHERGAAQWIDEDTPLVPVYSLHHRATSAVPAGREVWVVDSQTVLYDGPSVYGTELPAIRMAPDEWLDTPHGSTPLSNLAAPQDGLNMAMSSVLTNNANGAVTNLWVAPDSNLKRTEFEGATLWESEVAPQAINTVGSSPETYKLSESFRDFMVWLAHLNPVSLGQQQHQMSGSLAALLDAKSREAIAPFIRSYRWAVEAVGTRIIECYKRFAKVPRSLEVIVGEDRRYMLEKFTGERLNSISRVSVEARNSLLDTTSGKLAFVERLEAHPLFQQNPHALRILLSVYSSGHIDPLLLEPEGEDILIQSENEWMRRGESPPVRWDDDDAVHLAGHRKLVLNPKDRLDEALMAVLEEHEAKHREQAMLKASGALGPGAMPPMPGAAPPPPPGQPPASTPQGAAPEQPVEAEAMDAGASGPALPSMPVNPATGERAPSPQ